MFREFLLILVFVLCAWIMRMFVKLVDYFIENVLIPDPSRENVVKETCGGENCGKERSAAPHGLRMRRLLDKIRRRSKVMHNRSTDSVKIGTARPTQIRIRHYEQP